MSQSCLREREKRPLNKPRWVINTIIGGFVQGGATTYAKKRKKKNENKEKNRRKKEGFLIKDQKQVKREKKLFSINERKRTEIKKTSQGKY